jgi:hypothetical protein
LCRLDIRAKSKLTLPSIKPLDPGTGAVLNAVNDRIFVAIASYRDAQLVPTVEDCLAKAEHPQRVRFGICWQHGSEELTLPFADDPRFSIMDVAWRDSRGACWARAETMKLWHDEEWFFQIDAHSRFAPNWDTRMIAAAIQTGSERPLLSTYPCPFAPAKTPGGHEALHGLPQKIVIQRFDADGIPEVQSMLYTRTGDRSGPVPARFLAAGSIFAPGSFIEEVPYDPELYFHGEEIAMAVRAYTSGYDLFHPIEALLWHDYERHDATRHWTDHTPANEAAVDWKTLDLRSKDKIRRLLAGERAERYGLGSRRSLQEYESYAGISFRKKKIQDGTRLGDDPPNPAAPADWTDGIFTWMVRVLIDPATLPAGAFDPPRTWQIAIRDEQQREFYHRPFTDAELAALTGDESRIAVICEIESGIIPATWSLSPINRDKGWLRTIEGRLAEEDYSIIVDEDEAVSETL